MILLHSYLRWLILVLFILVLYRHLSAMLAKKAFVKTDATLSLVLICSLDIMLLIGIVVYFISPMGYAVFKILGSEVMQIKDIRKIAVEHPVQMILAIVLAHIAAAQRKKNITDAIKHKKMFWFYCIAFILILAGIPWNKLGV